MTAVAVNLNPVIWIY